MLLNQVGGRGLIGGGVCGFYHQYAADPGGWEGGKSLMGGGRSHMGVGGVLWGWEESYGGGRSHMGGGRGHMGGGRSLMGVGGVLWGLEILPSECC